MSAQKSILKSKSEKDWANLPNTVRQWFENALRSDDPKPSPGACIKLAREFQVIANRRNNAELWRQAECEGTVPQPSALKDESWEDIESRMIRKFKDAANQLLFEAEELESFFGGYQWQNGTSAVSLSQIQELLGRICAVPKAIVSSGDNGQLQEVMNVGGNKIVLRKVGPTLGRRKEAWHPAGHEIARAIKDAMRTAGYRGSLSAKKPESVTAQVGASTINWFFNTSVKISADGFASAMKSRDRSKGESLPLPTVRHV